MLCQGASFYWVEQLQVEKWQSAQSVLLHHRPGGSIRWGAGDTTHSHLVNVLVLCSLSEWMVIMSLIISSLLYLSSYPDVKMKPFVQKHQWWIFYLGKGGYTAMLKYCITCKRCAFKCLPVETLHCCPLQKMAAGALLSCEPRPGLAPLNPSICDNCFNCWTLLELRFMLTKNT